MEYEKKELLKSCVITMYHLVTKDLQNPDITEVRRKDFEKECAELIEIYKKLSRNEEEKQIKKYVKYIIALIFGGILGYLMCYLKTT